jgi:hypothetical protein
MPDLLPRPLLGSSAVTCRGGFVEQDSACFGLTPPDQQPTLRKYAISTALAFSFARRDTAGSHQRHERMCRRTSF